MRSASATKSKDAPGLPQSRDDAGKGREIAKRFSSSGHGTPSGGPVNTSLGLKMMLTGAALAPEGRGFFGRMDP